MSLGLLILILGCFLSPFFIGATLFRFLCLGLVFLLFLIGALFFMFCTASFIYIYIHRIYIFLYRYCFLSAVSHFKFSARKNVHISCNIYLFLNHLKNVLSLLVEKMQEKLII